MIMNILSVSNLHNNVASIQKNRGDKSLHIIVALDPGYTDMFSNRSVFISLRFQINPLWIAYSNMLPFHDRFHRFRVNRR